MHCGTWRGLLPPLSWTRKCEVPLPTSANLSCCLAIHVLVIHFKDFLKSIYSQNRDAEVHLYHWAITSAPVNFPIGVKLINVTVVEIIQVNQLESGISPPRTLPLVFMYFVTWGEVSMRKQSLCWGYWVMYGRSQAQKLPLDCQKE